MNEPKQPTLIDALILAARQRVESHTGRALITQTLDWSLDRFPTWFRVPKPPLQSVTSITYYDSDDAQQTLASSVYQVDIESQPARIVEAVDQFWPTISTRINAVTVRFVAGYGDGVHDIPFPIKAAMLLLVGEMWLRREDSAAMQTSKIPFGVDALLAPYVDWRF